MKKNKKWFILGVTFSLLGLSMPSCPGQKELQQELDMLHTADTDLGKKVQLLSTQLNALTNDMNQVKQLLPQITNIIESQKNALDQLTAQVHHAKSPTNKKRK